MRKRISSVTGSLPDLLAAFLAVLAVAYGSRALKADAGGMMNVADLCFHLGLATAFGYAAVCAFRATFRTNTRAPIRQPNPISPAISATYDWLESRVASRVTEWCGALGWRVEPNGRYLLVTLPGEMKSVVVFGVRIDGVPCLHIAVSPARGVLPREVLEFALRRNYRLGATHWCYDPYDGLLVRAVDPLARMNVERFEALVDGVIQERDDAMRVAEAEFGTNPDHEGGG